MPAQAKPVQQEIPAIDGNTKKKKNYNKPKSDEQKAFDAAMKALIDSRVKASTTKAKSLDAQIKAIDNEGELTDLMVKIALRINGLRIHKKAK